VTGSSQDAERLVEDALTYRDAALCALVWELRSRCAMAGGRLDDAEEYVRSGLAALQTVEVPLAAWRVQATAWQVQSRLNKMVAAEGHRRSAEAVLRRLADSLEGCDALQRSLLESRALQELSATSRRRRPRQSSAPS
jgi:hypothetical protein